LLGVVLHQAERRIDGAAQADEAGLAVLGLEPGRIELVMDGSRAEVPEDRLLAADQKWSFRYAIRRALVMNPSTPRSSAASQLRFLSQRDLCLIHEHPATSTYLRRCIERLRERVFVRMVEQS